MSLLQEQLFREQGFSDEHEQQTAFMISGGATAYIPVLGQGVSFISSQPKSSIL